MVRELSLQYGMKEAFSQSKSPARTTPANHSDRVILNTFMPAERIATISLLRWSEPNTYTSESKRLIGRITGTRVGARNA